MSELTKKDILKLAQLSRLQLTDSEVEKFSRELNEIIGYIEQLDKVDVSGLDPTYQVTGLQHITRDDQIIEYGATSSQLMAGAPAQQDGQFKVKRVLS